MHVVVTGASGFVGTVLITALADAGVTGVAVARRRIDRLPPGWVYEQRAVMLEDTRADVEALIHLEARHHQYVVGQDPNAAADAFRETNVENTRAWLKWADRSGVDRFLLFSSIKAIDPARATAGLDAIDETTPGPGPSLYGRSKWQAEELVRQWAETSPRRALILRPAVVYGPGNVGNIFSMVDAIARGRFVFLGPGNNVKSLVSVRNAAAATIHLLRRMERGCDVYHVVDADRHSIRELAAIIARHLDVPEPVMTVPLSLVRPVARISDVLSAAIGVPLPINTARLEAFCEHANMSPAKLIATGFVHPESPDEGLSTMVRWYRRERSTRR